jgi:hypothetical protein
MSEELAKAAFDGDVETVRRLLDEGADVDARGRNWSPLHAAIENGQVACVRLLIARGANVDVPNGGLSPLANAVDAAIDGTIQTGGEPGDEPTEIVGLLLEAGADPAPGLQIARDYKSTKLIELLTTKRAVDGERWFLDVSGFPDLLWARLQIFTDGSAEVLDLDGKVHRFSSEQEARYWLAEDEYQALESIDAEDLAYGGLAREELVPPSAVAQSELVPQMQVRRGEAPSRTRR